MVFMGYNPQESLENTINTMEPSHISAESAGVFMGDMDSFSGG